MNMKMVRVRSCDAEECAYNIKNKCHTIAITVGGGLSPLCDTSIIGIKKGGLPNITAGVGACKVESCQFNESFECIASGIRVKVFTLLPECATFKGRSAKTNEYVSRRMRGQSQGGGDVKKEGNDSR